MMSSQVKQSEQTMDTLGMIKLTVDILGMITVMMTMAVVLVSKQEYLEVHNLTKQSECTEHSELVGNTIYVQMNTESVQCLSKKQAYHNKVHVAREQLS